MLDENLPAFFLKPASDGLKHHQSIFLSHHGSDPRPAYTLQHADPASTSPTHKNCYAAALFDAYNPEVLFGEVLARPGWTQSSLSQDEIRRNGGIPPPPQPVIPTDFAVQLYNPDQQVQVSLKAGSWGASDSYEFSMPETTFRTPSASNLDRGQSDPASLAITPKVNFAWRKEKLSKDLTCYMTGKSTDTREKKKSKRDPDIAIALWRNMRELTVYEPNLGRVDIEDPKGLEVVLLLGAVVIKDLYFSSKERIQELFNISDTGRKLSSGGRKLSSPKTHSIVGMPNPLQSHPVVQPTPNEIKRNSLPRLQTTPPSSSSGQRRPPMTDPRAQWELDAETARLRAQAEAEAKQERRQREKAAEAEHKRLQKMFEEEEREARRKAAEVEKETERLRKLYGVQPLPSQQPLQQASRPMSNQRQQRIPGPLQPRLGSNGLYVNPAASASTLQMSGANPSAAGSSLGVPRPTKKKSFFGLRTTSDDGGEGRKLNKKSSAMW